MSRSVYGRARGTSDTGGRLTGWGVLGIVLLFFGTVGSVNAAMIYYAVSTFSGEEDSHAYEHGLAFDKDLSAANAQNALHWHVEGSLGRANSNAPADIRFAMSDADGKPLSGLTVHAAFEFPPDKARDHEVALRETASGVYSASAATAPGQWDVVVEASRQGERLFRSHSRVTLR